MLKVKESINKGGNCISKKIKKIWIDLINPSDVHFFNAFVPKLLASDIYITTRNRAETTELADSLNLNNHVLGTDSDYWIKKSLNMGFRTLELTLKIPTFDFSLSFENGMSVLVSKFRRKTSISYCDNDLKFIQSKSFIQGMETRIKGLSNYIFIPKACEAIFKREYDEEKIIEFSGYKEDIYIADYKPNPDFLKKIPFEEFIIIRPEALSSFYVKEAESIVPDLLSSFIREGLNIVYLPREGRDKDYAKGLDVFVPGNVLNGLDLCYYSSAVLTGSGTLAREAAIMNRKSISFFPSDLLLSVDKELIESSKIFHSRDVREITEYVVSKSSGKDCLDLSRSKKVKNEVLLKTNKILDREI